MNNMKVKSVVGKAFRVSLNLFRLVGAHMENTGRKMADLDVEKQQKKAKKNWNKTIEKLKV